MFKTIEPEGLCVVSEGQWECIDMAVDSGATETVMGEEMVACARTNPGAASKRGVEYEIADGTRIPNLGEKRFIGQTEEGISRGITAQVADVNKALLSVKKIVVAGSRVVFDEESYIEDRTTGEVTWLREEQGMYMLKLWVENEDF